MRDYDRDRSPRRLREEPSGRDDGGAERRGDHADLVERRRRTVELVRRLPALEEDLDGGLVRLPLEEIACDRGKAGEVVDVGERLLVRGEDRVADLVAEHEAAFHRV